MTIFVEESDGDFWSKGTEIIKRKLISYTIHTGVNRDYHEHCCAHRVQTYNHHDMAIMQTFTHMHFTMCKYSIYFWMAITWRACIIL